MVKFRKMLVNNEGFTLIELLVVIAVLGILAAIAIPRISGVTQKAEESELRATGSSLRSAIEMYIAEKGEFPGNTGDDGLAFTDSDFNIGISLGDYDNNVGTATTTGYSVTLTKTDGSGNSVTVTVDDVTVSY